MKALRFSKNIENDIKRNFSCYMGDWFVSEKDAKETIEERKIDAEIGYDEESKMYGIIHHYGLSCFSCEDMSDEEIDEYSKTIEWEGFGYRTIGNIKIIKEISKDIWLLEVDDLIKE